MSLQQQCGGARASCPGARITVCWAMSGCAISGCTGTDSVYVSLITADIAQADTTLCGGDSLSLSVAKLVALCCYLLGARGERRCVLLSRSASLLHVHVL